MPRGRADKILVELGLFESRSAARAAIEHGKVFADGVAISRPAQALDSNAEIQAEPAHPYVSRGGLKLAHALSAFNIDVGGATALDIGASTGGFTDVLLKHGAKRVVALDVGRGQLHPKLRIDPRVENLEGQDARSVELETIDRPSVITVDASFISLQKLLDPVLAQIKWSCRLIALFKPQFEVGRAGVGRGGIVRDGQAVTNAQSAIQDWLAETHWPIEAWCDSPIRGGDGNKEYLFVAKTALE